MSPCRRAKRILWLRLRRAQHSARDQARRALGAARAARAHAPPRDGCLAQAVCLERKALCAARLWKLLS